MKRKKMWIVLIALLLIVLLGAGGYQAYRFPDTFRSLLDKSADEKEVGRLVEQMREKKDKKVLVAYFSYSGTTKGIANAISEKIGADLFEIKTKKEYSNVYTESNREIRKNEKPELADAVEEPEAYDIVFVGYPIWWSDMPQIMYTFFDTYDLKGKNIIPFCTHAGSGLSGTVGRIKKLEPQATVYKGLAIYRTDVTGSDSKVKSWIKKKAK